MLLNRTRKMARSAKNRFLLRALLDALEPRMLLSGNTYNFINLFNFGSGAGGSNPYATLVADSQGDLFGTTSAGGANGKGSLFEIPANSLVPQTFYSFTGSPDGSAPNAGVVFDSDGNMFGTTATGGANGKGVVWEVVASTNTLTVIYSFTGGTDGATPAGNLVINANGDLIGTTTAGGTFNDGTVWAIPSGTTTALGLHQFSGGADGAISYSGVTLDSRGNIYGVAFSGGSHNNGTVFEISTLNTYSVLHTFTGKPDGSKPTGKLVFDAGGNLWGTTSSGGTANDGTVFEITSPNTTISTYATIVSFTGAANGSEPIAGLTLDSHGNLFGSTFIGGAHNVGTIFEIPASSNQLTTLFAFNGPNGDRPYSSLYVDSTGTLIGSTVVGGTAGFGTLFEFKPTLTTQIVFHTGPSDIAAGKIMSPVTVYLEKSDNSIDTADNSIVTLALSSGPNGGTLLGTVTAQAHNGVITFNDLHLPKTGLYSIVATDGSLSSNPSGTFNVLPGPASQVIFTAQPGSLTAGQDLGTITVQVEDANGNLVTTNSSTVTLSVGKGPGNITGTLSAQAVGGVATFTGLSINQAGPYFITASDGNLKAGHSANFNVTPDTTTAHLVLTTQPATPVVVGKNLSPDITVAVEDQFGNILTTNRDSITLSIISGPSGGSLTGHAVIAAHSGVARFSNISLPLAGSYTIQAADAALIINTPVSFSETVAKGTTSVAAPHVSAAYSFGDAITLNTKLQSNAPTNIPFTGSVGIYDNTNTLITTATLSANGTIKAILNGLTTGSYTYTVQYAGDASHTAITSSAFTVVVDPAATSTSLATSANSLAFGQALTLTATVSSKSSGGTPTGTVTFFDNGSPIGSAVALSGDQASLPIPTPTVGKHVYSAMYGGDSNFVFDGSSNHTVTVNPDKTTVALQSSVANPITSGSPFNITATVSVVAPGVGTPTGTVIIKDGRTPLGTLTLASGAATLSNITLTAKGRHMITATYGGDPTDSAATSHPLALTIV